MELEIGTPSYGGNKKNTWKLKDGSNVYRILPPLGSLAKQGRWCVFESIHWGYKGSRGFRSFRCIQQKNKQKMVTTQCPECNLIAERKAALDKVKGDLKTQGRTDEQIKVQTKPVADWLYAHNLDRKWYLNVMNTQGEIGRLAVPHRMMQALEEKIKDLLKKGIDPLAVDGGVYFDLKRVGTGVQTAHSVSWVTEEVQIPGSTETFERAKKAPLTKDILSRLPNEAWDLGNKNMFRTLSFDEIKRLVANPSPEVVDAVFSAPESTATGATTGVGNVADDEPDMETIQAMGVAAPVETAPPVVTPTPSAAKLSNAEFLEQFGIK